MASYVDSILGPGETVAYQGHTTNWIFFWPWVIAILLVAASTFSGAWLLIGGAAIVGGVVLLFPFIRQKSTELAVTDRRVIAKFGLVSRRTIEMRMSKIESIRIDQSLWERMGGFGTVVIHGTGGAAEPIPQVRDPLAFKRAVEVQLEAFEDTGRTAAGGRLQ